jgi:hypothetical protein
MLVTRQERILAIDGDYIHVCVILTRPFNHGTDRISTDYALRQQS